MSQDTSEPFSDHTPGGVAAAEGTMSLVLLIAACSSMVSRRLPPVLWYTQAMATESAVT